ncbi:MAG: ubiquinone/menaquinone biosynthesis methyltransferase [Roseiflexaceae bacterium]|nr:ubiquinone/menaquinone biosynthesis methyltransferase [Roseiflexus sp.]MDW8214564.1 ubiquinone/menaquinone biosynthesis methyltransferase [Roseiflexaceae bacterium]
MSTSVLPPPDKKAEYVERMFSRIAPGYDMMNGIMTLGLDRGWRAATVALAAPPSCGRALDIGTGTGDFLVELAEWMPDGLAVGVDFTIPMMRAGLSKIAGKRAVFVAGDALALPFADESFDAITTGFTLRNVTDIGAAFREMWRVARVGGTVACLEVARPRQPLLRFGHWVYFQRVVPLLARVLGADPEAYTYLPQSARVFPPPDELAQIMREAGWSDVTYRLVGLGAAAIHTGIKRG